MPLAGYQIALRPCLWVYGRFAREFGRDLDHRLIDKDRNRIQIAGIAFQAQSLRFQRQGTAAGKGVVKGGKLVAVKQLFGAGMVNIVCAGRPPALPDLGPRPLQHLLVGGVLPLHEILNDLEQTLPLLLLRLLGPENLRVARRVIDHLSEDDRPRRRQRSPRPPKVQRARVPVPDRLLSRRSNVDRLQRQRHFNELLPCYHLLTHSCLRFESASPCSTPTLLERDQIFLKSLMPASLSNALQINESR